MREVEYPYSEIKNEKYDEVKLIVKTGNTSSTITLDDLPRFRENLPLSPKSSDLKKGFPLVDYLREKSKDYLNSILKKYDEEPI